MSGSNEVIVTGAGGYIGPHLVHGLVERGYSVTALVRPGSVPHIDPRARVEHCDVLHDPTVVERIAAAEGLVHLAWQDGFVHNSPAHMEQVSAHFRLLTAVAARGVRRIVALGTMHEVGYWEGAITASTPTNPLSAYGIAKDALRRALPLAIGDSSSFSWARCFYIYGDDRRSQSVFSRLVSAHEAGQKIFPFTSGQNKYDFIRVEELGRQLAALYARPDVTGVVNCCSGVPVSLGDQVQRFIDENELDLTLEYGAYPDRAYDSPAVWGDAAQIQQILQQRRPS